MKEGGGGGVSFSAAFLYEVFICVTNGWKVYLGICSAHSVRKRFGHSNGLECLFVQSAGCCANDRAKKTVECYLRHCSGFEHVFRHFTNSKLMPSCFLHLNDVIFQT